MFKLRRRGLAPATASDLPFCVMCGQAIRVDAVTGRCALGHRVSAPALAAAGDETAELMDAPAEDHSIVTYDEQPYTRSPAPAPAPAWEPAAVTEDPVDSFGDFLSWDQPSDGSSALDVDPAALAESPSDDAGTVAPVTTELAANLLDELDDAAHARRKAVGTLGASLAVSLAFAGAVAALPF